MTRTSGEAPGRRASSNSIFLAATRFVGFHRDRNPAGTRSTGHPLGPAPNPAASNVRISSGRKMLRSKSMKTGHRPMTGYEPRRARSHDVEVHRYLLSDSAMRLPHSGQIKSDERVARSTKPIAAL